MSHKHPVIDGDKHFIIDPITRAVTNAESKKTILMQNDHNSERYTFEIDKVVEGHDMTLCNSVEIHYTNMDTNRKNKNIGVYEVNDVEVSPDNSDKIIFSWLVSENATLYAGSLQFLIVFKCVENGDTTYRWNSGVNTSISIAKGMNNGEAIEEAYPDILSQWKDELFAAVFGMETVVIGPTEPETYPYIWFDTSKFVGSSEKGIGTLTVKDANGEVHVLYPFTHLKATDAAGIETELKELLKITSALSENDELHVRMISDLDKVTNKDVTANNLETVDEGYVLDARQGKELKNMVDAKASVTDFTITLLATGWVGYGPYTQTVAAEGILQSDMPIGDISLENVDDIESVSENWSLVVKMTTGDGHITAYAYTAMPTVDMTINVKVVR